MVHITIVVNVTKEQKSSPAETGDRSCKAWKVVSGAAKAMTVSALLSWVKNLLDV